MRFQSHRKPVGVTLLELLCVVAIITILAGMWLGPVSRVLARAHAEKRAEQVQEMLDSIVQRLQKAFQGQTDFPTVTLTSLEAGRLLEPSQLRFLRSRRVTFHPFCGADPEEQLVIEVRLERGFLADLGSLTVTKGEITKPLEGR